MRRITIIGTIVGLLFSTLFLAAPAGAQNPTAECADAGGTYVDKIDSVNGSGTYTSDEGVTYTVTVTDNPNPEPDSFTVSPDPATQYPAVTGEIFFFGKFGEGGGLSHITICARAVEETPTATATNVPPTATDVPPTATDVPQTATTVPGEPSPTNVPPTATDVPGEPTKVPQQAEPTEPAPGVTVLPSTGSDGGASSGSQALILLVAASATVMAGAGAILANHSRGRQQQ